MADKANRKEKLIAAFKSGDFLDAVYNIHQVELDEREDLPLEIATLHNDGHINVVAEFEKLDNTPGSGLGFFIKRNVFDAILPHIDAPTRDVMRCMLRLHKGAGAMLGGTEPQPCGWPASDLPGRKQGVLRPVRGALRSGQQQ